MRQRPDARNPGLLPPGSLPVSLHSGPGGRVVVGALVWSEVGGVVVVVVVTATARVVPVGSEPFASCSPRQPTRAAIAATPMTAARMTDQRRYQGGVGSSMGRRC